VLAVGDIRRVVRLRDASYDIPQPLSGRILALRIPSIRRCPAIAQEMQRGPPHLPTLIPFDAHGVEVKLQIEPKAWRIDVAGILEAVDLHPLTITILPQ
jgi:hypothetical protein